MEYKQELSNNVVMTSQHTDEDYQFICASLKKHNADKTFGLLYKPGKDIELYLRDNDQLIGAICCETWNMCMYIDVLWLNEAYRGRGYGKKLIGEAEKMAKEIGCIFVHTCTFSYQSPDFYKACGYDVFAELKDYPDGIIQYFLKKQL